MVVDLPEPSVATFDRLEEELIRLRGHRSRLAPDDEEGARDIKIAMESVRRALSLQSQALELRREKRLLQISLERLEARLAEIEEVRKDPTRKLRYLKGPTEPERVLADMALVKKRLAHIDKTGPL